MAQGTDAPSLITGSEGRGRTGKLESRHLLGTGGKAEDLGDLESVRRELLLDVIRSARLECADLQFG